MEFREVPGGGSVQRPAIDRDDLAEKQAAFKGEFAYEDARFSGIDQAGVRGEGSLRRCSVSGVDLSGADLPGLDMMDVCLEGVDLSNARLRAGAVRRVELLRCRGVGLRLTLEQARDLYVQDSRLDYAVIEVGRVKGLAVFEGCSFREAVITGDLSGLVFSNCDFTGAEFTASRAQGCDLRSSRLGEARGLLSLRGAKISADQAVTAAEALAAEAGLVLEP
jgi:uncharacterized protein YjbI with pentapeptide repeats